MRLAGRIGALASVALAAVTIAAAPAEAVVYQSSIIASGLDNPRGLAFGLDGALYIAEGGTFNNGPVGPSGEGPAAYGTTGAISRVDNGVQTRIISDLPSFTNINTGSASGPQDIAFYNGVGYFVVGLGANPAVRTNELGSAPGAANLGSLYSFTGATVTKIADLAGYEASENPTGDQIDSNPYHLTAGANGLLVTDAGGNSLLNVTAGGAVSTAGTFADVGYDAVPTGVSVGPDGAFYVGQLTGFPFPVGGADIFRIDPLTGIQSIYATGFTNITDIAWGADGSLYVLQIADNGLQNGPFGSIQKLNADGTHSLVYGGLFASTGLEIGRDGSFYVTQNSSAPGVGQVLRIFAVPEPATWAMMLIGFGAVGMMARRRQPVLANA
ncbi:ScyD/ScyE family protein [Sphingomonas quercus]|uniref:ScyD/ScyE family protein n=1 Tax=Sphingomonas quercus TaxID=2842451 RepID=A0ABS6BD43_9SPHN|nr:ScyD/ScyE family protein [Sphingomonas quercus]MBU3076247.1 ScyD/ScyE family protein [Sphingomonas quercus]